MTKYAGFDVEHGCPFGRWPDKYHSLGHELMDDLVENLKVDFPKMAHDDAASIMVSTLLVTVIRFQSLPDDEGCALTGTIGVTGMVPIDTDRVAQGIRFCEAADAGELNVDWRKFVTVDGDNPSGSRTARILAGAALQALLVAILDFDPTEPLPKDHELHQAVRDAFKAGATMYDAGAVLTLKSRERDTRAQTQAWAMTLQTMGGRTANKMMTKTLGGGDTPFIACFTDVEAIRHEGSTAFVIGHSLELSSLGENITFFGVKTDQPN